MPSPDQSLRRLHSVADFRAAARRAVPQMVFDYMDGAAGSESTARENLRAFERVRLVPSGPVDVSTRSTATTLFGRELAFPLIIGPTGLTSAFHPRGELAMARAAGRAGVPYVLANASSCTPEEAMTTGSGQKWFQLYLPPSRELLTGWLDRLKAANYDTIEITVDTALPGLRNRDMQNQFSMPFHWSLHKVLQCASRPRWSLRMLRYGVPVPSLMVDGPRQRHNTASDAVLNRISPATSWEDIAWVRERWPGKLIVKGVTDARQAGRALATGVDAIVVSNHGGRQLDGAVATLQVLPEFVSEVGGRMPILLDSGVRTGSDIAKALALGATAVQVGRATLWGLAAGGEEGALRVLTLLKAEFDNAMGLCGATSPAGLGRASVTIAAGGMGGVVG